MNSSGRIEIPKRWISPTIKIANVLIHRKMDAVATSVVISQFFFAYAKHYSLRNLSISLNFTFKSPVAEILPLPPDQNN
jgi:hypothetical protein